MENTDDPSQPTFMKIGDLVKENYEFDSKRSRFVHGRNLLTRLNQNNLSFHSIDQKPIDCLCKMILEHLMLVGIQRIQVIEPMILVVLISYVDGNWYHICGWYNSNLTPDKKIFIDGSKVIEITSGHSGNNLGSNERPQSFGFIGWGSEAGTFDGNTSSTHRGDYMEGKIDDVRIYNRALTDEEISNLYIREKP